MSKKIETVAGYIRVSTEEQVEGKSLEAQRDSIAAYAAANGYDLVELYADEGVSAHTERLERRPALSRLLKDAESGRFDLVVVHTIDRWARNMRVQGEALQRLGDAKVGFASITENIDFTTPSGKLMLTMIGGFSEFFSDQLGVHVSKSQAVRARAGLPVGPLPFGYVAGATPDAPPQLVDDEAAAVRECFLRRAEGQSMGEIALWLREQGFRTRKDNQFTPFAVKDMLANRFYAGVVRYSTKVSGVRTTVEHDGLHTPIIDEDLWQDVRRRRAVRTRRRSRKGETGVLQGRIKCAHCLNSLWSEVNANGFPLYREKHAHDCPTNYGSIGAKKIDGVLAAALTSIALPPDVFKAIAEFSVDPTNSKKREAELDDDVRRLTNLYRRKLIDDNEWDSEMARIEEQRRGLEPVKPERLKVVEALCADLQRLWKEATPEERRALVAPLIDEVYVDLQVRKPVAVRPHEDFRVLVAAAFEAADSGIRVISQSEFLGEDLQLVGLVETGENTPPSVPHSLWLPYPVEPAWGAHNVAWLDAA